jgi:hypothetical protein
VGAVLVGGEVNVVIFSKNRAMQLDALLWSMSRFAPHLLPATVLTLATEDRYQDAYQILERGHSSKVTLLWQGCSFKDDVISALNPDKMQSVFLVDDDVFYRPAPIAPDLKSGQCFSFRLGSNIRVDSVTGNPQAPGTENFQYAYSLDGHVFRTDEILPLIRRLRFDGPNRLEEAMQKAGPTLEVLYDWHGCFVGIPHNLVQTAWPVVSMGGSAAELNDRYLAGGRIDTDAMDFSAVISTHQSIPYVYRYN